MRSAVSLPCRRTPFVRYGPMINSIDGSGVAMTQAPIVRMNPDADIHGGLIVCCFPTVGFVSSIVAHYLVERLDLVFSGGVRHPDLPPVCLVQDGSPMPPIRFYTGAPQCNVDQCDKLVLIASEIRVPSRLTLQMSEVLLEWSKGANLSCGLIIDAYSQTGDQAHQIMDDDESEETLLGIGATEPMREQLVEMGVPLLKHGVIGGMTGVLMGECRRRGLSAMAILAEANGPVEGGFPDARAAARIIEKLDILLPAVHLETEPLIAEAERIEDQIREMMSVQFAAQAEDDDEAAPSMLYG